MLSVSNAQNKTYLAFDVIITTTAFKKNQFEL